MNNREIKFRIWNKLAKEMLPSNKAWSLGMLNGGERSELAVMQFTGLKDKNGKEIYEGDIISNNTGAPRMEVIFNQGCFTLEGLEPIVGYVDGIGQIDQTNFLEVIGNIYENQALLK